MQVNLLTEGPNQLKVGDKVRLRDGSITVIGTTASLYRFSHTNQPISDGVKHWHANGYWWGGVQSRHDIIGIIRPGRVTFEDED